MDQQALEYTRSHYNRHSNQYTSTKHALHARKSGPGAPLKYFHNSIKRALINRCVKRNEKAIERGALWATGTVFLKRLAKNVVLCRSTPWTRTARASLPRLSN